MSRAARRAMVRRPDPELSLSRQCRLLSIGRSWLYYTPQGESAETLARMRRIDELFLKDPVAWIIPKDVLSLCFSTQGIT